jgi:hypothetical protein
MRYSQDTRCSCQGCVTRNYTLLVRGERCSQGALFAKIHIVRVEIALLVVTRYSCGECVIRNCTLLVQGEGCVTRNGMSAHCLQ